MTDSPDAIRADIERTRGELGQDVDALADKVSPTKALHRQGDKVRGALGSLRDRVMGAADDAGSTVSSAASGVSDAARSVTHKAEGNPLAVGLIAFGAGLLVSSLIPASGKEKRLAGQVREQAQPLVDEVKNVAQDVADDLKEPAQEAVGAVKDRAQEAVSTVKDEASDATETVTDRAEQARDDVTGA